MNYIKLLIVSIVLLSLTSCEQVTWSLARLMGIRKPKIESKESVLRFLERIGQDTMNVFALDTNLYNLFRNQPFKPEWDTGLRPIQVRVYDQEQKPVMQWASCEGYLDDLGTFDSMPPRNFDGLNTSIDLQADISRYYTLDGNPANLKVPEGYDYHILVYFALWFPKLSKESFHIIEEYIREHPNQRFNIYKINMDILDFWGYDEVILEDTKFQ